MPAYNAAAYIAEAIESVINQEFIDWELVIINDGSTDATPVIIQQHRSDKRIILINQENKRLGAARNAGIANAKGDWICFLDADDSWLPNKLKAQYAFISNNPKVDVLYSDGYTFDQRLKFRLPYDHKVAKGWHSGAEMYGIEFVENSIPVLSACVKKDWIEKAYYHDERINGAEDWDYWLQLARIGATFYGSDQRLFIYRVHSDSMSARHLNQQTASAFVLIKNFDRKLLSEDVIVAFISDLKKLGRELAASGRRDDLKLISDFMGQNYPPEKIRQMSKMKGKSFDLANNPFKGWIWKLLRRAAKVLLFKPYNFYKKYAHHLTIQYYRWKLGDQLEIRGNIYIHPKAELIFAAVGAKMITHGIAVKDFTQINLSTEKSYLITGKNVTVNRLCTINVWDGNLVIGSNVLINSYSSINCMQHIEIGDDTWMGEGVRLYDHNHEYKNHGTPFTDQGMTVGNIKIGDNCWIGSNTIILKNVTIGNNCVIGANNLIYKSIPANTVVKARAMQIIDPTFAT
jgi:teichuronic acid biosynthesis glycosyltransferase TuaG